MHDNMRKYFVFELLYWLKKYIELGFKLELYSPSEYCATFYFLEYLEKINWQQKQSAFNKKKKREKQKDIIIEN